MSTYVEIIRLFQTPSFMATCVFQTVFLFVVIAIWEKESAAILLPSVHLIWMAFFAYHRKWTVGGVFLLFALAGLFMSFLYWNRTT